MYHRPTIDRRLDLLVANDARRVAAGEIRADDAFQIIDVSETEHGQRSADLIDLIDLERGGLSRKLQPDELRWVRHEQMRCTVDFLYALRYARINDYRNQLSAFHPNLAQQIVLNVWAEMEDLELAIMMIQLKARQLGVSTLSELAIAHRNQFYPDVNAVVASADPVKSEKMFGIITLNWRHQPWFLMPRMTRESSKVVEFGDLNSGITIQHGSQMSGIARGTTPSVIHLSEVSSWVDPENLIEASILRAFHETPWHFFIMESTAAGLYGYWPKKWRECRKGWDIRQSRFYPLFLPWFVATDLYPTESWLKKQPIPPKWVPSDIVIAHAERARLYVRSNPLLAKVLGSNWVMPREQQWYYESEYQTARENKRLNIFLSEMPADEHEAFQSTQESAFEPEVITFHRNHAGSKEPLGVYGFIGKQDEIPVRFQPHMRDIDMTRKRITVECKRSTNQSMHTSVELVPLKFEGYVNEVGRLYIWEWPKPGEDYGIGVDTGYGRGKDACALEGIIKSGFEHGPRQVCEFASNYVSAFDFWPMCLAVAEFFSPSRMARAVIECRGSGDSVQLEMRKRGWTNFHPWVQYDNRRIRPDQGAKLGWFTNQSSRELMLDAFMTAANDNWLEIRSPWLVDEMASLSRDEGKQSFRAEYGAHDDRVMGISMVLVSLHILDLQGFRARKLAGDSMQSITMRSPEDQEVLESGWQPGAQDTGQMTPELKGYMTTMRRVGVLRANALRRRGVLK